MTIAEMAVSEQRVETLRAKQTELTGQIEELADRAKAGDATGLAEMPALAEQKSSVDRELAVVEAELQRATQEREAAIIRQKRERFEKLIVQGKGQREEFEQLFGEACFTLGSLCATIEEAGKLLNEIAPSFNGEMVMMPRDRNLLAQISTDLNPLPRVRDSLLIDNVRGFGWDFTFPVVALRKKGNVSQ